jgi:hypothetical protein
MNDEDMKAIKTDEPELPDRHVRSGDLKFGLLGLALVVLLILSSFR